MFFVYDSIRTQMKRKKFEYEKAHDVRLRALKLIKNLQLNYLQVDRLFFYRSSGSKARAYARAWGLPKLWQNALGIEPAYIIEVLSNHFDKLSTREQDKVILHELTHIPRNFSGALVAHTRRRKGSFKDKLDNLIEIYMRDKRIK